MTTAIAPATRAPAPAGVSIRPATADDLVRLGQVAAAAFENHPETVVTWPARAGNDEDAKAAEEERVQSETNTLREAFSSPRCLLEVAEANGEVVGFTYWVLPDTIRDVFAGPTSEASAEDEDDNQSDDSATEVGDFKFINSRAEEALENSKQQLVGVASKLFGRASKVLGLQCLAVSPGHQNLRIGTSLLQKGKNLAFSRGWRIVAVCAGKRNLRFYKHRNFVCFGKTKSRGVRLYGIVDR